MEINDLRLEWLDPHTLKPNPANPKIHGAKQRRAFREHFAKVGWAGALLLNRRTGNLLDGHMRQLEAIEAGLTEVPVLVVDVDPEVERQILALNDPIGRLFDTDEGLLEDLLRQLDQVDAELLEIALGRKGEDQEEAVGEEEEGTAERAAAEFPEGGFSIVPRKEWNYILLVFHNELDWLAAQEHFQVKPVMCPFTKAIGLGRVVDGGKYLARLRGE